MGIISLAIMIVTLAANWRLYQKMGRQGWESIIPLYNVYVQFEVLYGNGARMFLLLIPFYNIYVAIKLQIDLAHAFNKTTGFGWGLVFLNTIFICILGFGDAQYLDGSHAIQSNDAVSNVLDNIGNSVSNNQNAASQARSSENALETLKELSKLHQEGILTDEEFNQKKTELLQKI